jgi:arsenite methyltransferase
VVEQRRTTLHALALRPGERVLDVGSGPGLLVAEMAQAVGPAGRVTGLDVSDAMLALAQWRCADLTGAGRTSFVKADAAALPFADGAFDVAVSTQVYEYVADLPAALDELHRVLRPDGRVLILDTDWDSIVWNAIDAKQMTRLLAAWMERFADPSGRLRSLRSLPLAVLRHATASTVPRFQGQGSPPGQATGGSSMPDAQVSFAGNLTDDPELRHTEGGIARATLRVAVSGRRDGEPSFFTVVVWRDQADHAAESLSKGRRVVVVGRLQQRAWTTEDGSARQVVEVVAEELGPSLRWATATPSR